MSTIHIQWFQNTKKQVKLSILHVHNTHICTVVIIGNGRFPHTKIYWLYVIYSFIMMNVEVKQAMYEETYLSIQWYIIRTYQDGCIGQISLMCAEKASQPNPCNMDSISYNQGWNITIIWLFNIVWLHIYFSVSKVTPQIMLAIQFQLREMLGEVTQSLKRCLRIA